MDRRFFFKTTSTRYSKKEHSYKPSSSIQPCHCAARQIIQEIFMVKIKSVPIENDLKLVPSLFV